MAISRFVAMRPKTNFRCFKLISRFRSILNFDLCFISPLQMFATHAPDEDDHDYQPNGFKGLMIGLGNRFHLHFYNRISHFSHSFQPRLKLEYSTSLAEITTAPEINIFIKTGKTFSHFIALTSAGFPDNLSRINYQMRTRPSSNLIEIDHGHRGALTLVDSIPNHPFDFHFILFFTMVRISNKPTSHEYAYLYL